MIQNLRSCRQRIKALAGKECKFGCISIRFEYIIDESANETQYSLSNLKSY